jgi:hypothetical protein
MPTDVAAKIEPKKSSRFFILAGIKKAFLGKALCFKMPL